MGAPEVAAAKAAWSSYIDARQRYGSSGPLTSYIALRTATNALNGALDALTAPEIEQLKSEVN